MSASPFDDPAIQTRIQVDLARIQARWLEEYAEPTEGDFDTKIIQTLVECLDAHANAYLIAVADKDLVPGYVERLRQVGKDPIHNAQRRSVLQDPYDDDSLRKKAESAGGFRLGIASLTPSQQENEIRKAVERIRVKKSEQIVKRQEWQTDMLFRIETRFEARYRHWMAEAMEQAQRQAESGNQKANGQAARGMNAQKWDEVEISFLSEERVQIRVGEQLQTCNYAELGFDDHRNGKPSKAWAQLQELARSNGTIGFPPKGHQKDWRRVEKRAQEIRSLLRKYFQITNDPLPYVPGTGYRTLFRISLAPSFET